MIPVIDLAPYIDGSDPGRVARRVDEAAREIGFFLITGHGFDPGLLQRMRRAALDFFRQPVDRKLASSRSRTIAGYSPLRAERVAYSRGKATPPDLQEAFAVTRPAIDLTDPYFTLPGARGWFPPNVFPPEPADLEPAAIAYYWALAELCRTMVRLFAVALDLPTDFFVPYVDRPIGTLRLTYYPGLREPPLPGQLRAGPHSDFGTFTLLQVDDAPGGLEVQDADGQWVDVPVIEGSFVCNIGDLLERWTNCRWTSALHRVVLPPDDQAEAAERLSLVYFNNANWDSVVQAVPTCVDATHPPRFAPITAGDYVRRKLDEIAVAG